MRLKHTCTSRITDEQQVNSLLTASEPSSEVALDSATERSRALERENRRLTLAIQRLTRLVYIDELTGLANRRYLDMALECEIRRASRGSAPLTFMLCDVDHFKSFNDRFGHQCGDEVLRKVGDIMRGYCGRAGEVAARYGGEEFSLLLPGMPLSNVIGMADCLRRSVAGVPFRPCGGSDVVRITISIGIATFPASHLNVPCGPQDVVYTADMALYRAKQAGRNRIKRKVVERIPGSPSASLQCERHETSMHMFAQTLG